MEQTKKQDYYFSGITALEIDTNVNNIEKDLDKIRKDSTERLWRDIVRLIRTKSSGFNNVIRISDIEVNFGTDIIPNIFGPKYRYCYEKCDFEAIFTELRKEFGNCCIEGSSTSWKFRYYANQKMANEMTDHEIKQRNDLLTIIETHLNYKFLNKDFIVTSERTDCSFEFCKKIAEEMNLLFGKESIKILENYDTEDIEKGFSFRIKICINRNVAETINLRDLLIKTA